LSSEALGLGLRGAHVQWNETNGMGGEALGGLATYGAHVQSSSQTQARNCISTFAIRHTHNGSRH